MALRQNREKSQEPTRDRILHHALMRFSTQSYERTGLREIAADAGVDVALVHRSFGSKEKLFAQCVRASIELGGILTKPGTSTLDDLFAEVVRPREEGEWSPIDIMARSFSSEDAARVLRDVGMELVLAPLVKTSPHGSDIKIALSVSLLFGFAMMRDIIGVDTLKNADTDDITRMLGQALDVLNRNDDGSQAPQTGTDKTV
jgi:AcrR family transcriptional regulator